MTSPTTLWNLLLVTTYTLLFVREGRCVDNTGVATKEVLTILTNPQVYNSAIRPTDLTGGLTVNINMFIRRVEIDDVNMEATVDMSFRMKWKDSRLKYNTKGVTAVTLLEPHLLWLPDPFFRGAISIETPSTIHPHNMLRVYPDGSVLYSLGLIVTQHCSMDLNRFPHDNQECDFTIASYAHTTKDISFLWVDENTPVAVGQDVEAQRFDIEGVDARYCNSTTSTGSYSCLQMVLELNRSFSTYLLEWYLPTIFLVVVAALSELLPTSALLPRLVLVLTPLITLAASSTAYSRSLAPVGYIRALDVFNYFSALVIFVILVHVVIAYARSVRATGAEGKQAAVGGEGDEEAAGGSVEPWWSNILKNPDYIFCLVIAFIYLFFLLVYFAAYCS